MVYSENRFLTLEEMTVNAEFILSYLSPLGWTKNAVCGMLGNMQTESTINPGIWQNLDENNMSMGYGLVQWTPATKYTDWADSNGYSWGDIVGQLERIEYELANGLQWISTTEFPMTFAEFKISTETPEYLADAFITNYERPADPDQPIRGEQARYWFNTLSGNGSVCVELAQFPMDYLYVTQGEDGSYSHQGELSIDFVGTTTNYPYYAPCKCELIGRDDVNAIMTWKSIGQVMCADGQLRQIVWRCIHDDNLLYDVGKILYKGQLMGASGNSGNSSGDHFHLDVWLGTTFTRTNPLHIYDVFAVNGVNIVEGYGYNWRTSDYVDCSNDGGGNPQTGKNNIIALLLSGAINGW